MSNKCGRTGAAVLLKASIAGGTSLLTANGRHPDLAFAMGFGGRLADDIYQAYVPQHPDFIGNGDGGGQKEQ